MHCFVTFSHEHGSWLAGVPGNWRTVSPALARLLVDCDAVLLDI